ncbi:unnamed protein product [Brassicogethes aeneus]|uniref:Uncharacterized protein n=1 Tax=Brassicogethes aeneus TaxID=1431903 RepID=A0A9P0BFH2_BRAAE|nr:unnamed protein product [Brassicogethes aeneus]
MFSLNAFLEDFNFQTFTAINEELKESSQIISNEIEDFLKDCKHIQSQVGTGKYVPLSETNRREKENEPQNEQVEKKTSGRQSRHTPLQVKTADLFDVKKNKIVKESETRESSTASNEIAMVKIKKEKEDMPAPTLPAPRKKKIKTEPPEQPVTRSTRSKAKKVMETIKIKKEPVRKDSDVIMENTPVPVVDITEDESDLESSKTKAGRKTRTKTKAAANSKQSETSTRSTRTKTRAQQNCKRERDPAEEGNQEIKKSRSTSSTREEIIQSPLSNTSIQTEYEDAVSTVENNTNATYVATNNTVDTNSTYVASTDNANKTNTPSNNINTTVVIPNPSVIQNAAGQQDDLMTDDDSDIEIKKRPKAKPKSKKKSSGDVKTIFNPFEPSPVKKKVEAFEKLGESSGIPVSNKFKGKRDVSGLKSGSVKETSRLYTPTTTSRVVPGAVKEASKTYTPTASKFVPKVCSTTKINKGVSGMSGNESILSGKTVSEVKATQAEYRERKRREAEALKKKEELRKKREEAQIKAQENKEREKQRFMEQQRLKEERTKQVKAEKEEKINKMKEEHERKRLQAKEKAVAIKQAKEKEEALRAEEKRKAQLLEQKAKAKLNLPKYMTTPAPLLPTEDCYDSDDERSKKKIQISWCSYQNIKESQIVMHIVGEACKNTFFCRQAITPDLQDIFGTMESHKLKRTSSAVWRKPPRYTLMPTIQDETTIHDEFDDDDDY